MVSAVKEIRVGAAMEGAVGATSAGKGPLRPGDGRSTKPWSRLGEEHSRQRGCKFRASEVGTRLASGGPFEEQKGISVA